MACVNPDGSVSRTARTILEALASGKDGEELARATSLPPYRVRASIRELRQAGLITPDDSGFSLTDQGRRALT